jgi:phosphoglycerate-specific signal transduction histidine kinase
MTHEEYLKERMLAYAAFLGRAQAARGFLQAKSFPAEQRVAMATETLVAAEKKLLEEVSGIAARAEADAARTQGELPQFASIANIEHTIHEIEINLDAYENTKKGSV